MNKKYKVGDTVLYTTYFTKIEGIIVLDAQDIFESLSPYGEITLYIDTKEYGAPCWVLESKCINITR